MYIETIIARTEHQLALSDLAQTRLRDGIVVENRRGLVNAIKRLFQRIAATADNGMTRRDWSEWRDNIASPMSHRPGSGLR
jgi:hypothetical protein